MSKIDTLDQRHLEIQSKIRNFKKTGSVGIRKWNYNQYLSSEKIISLFIKELMRLKEEIEIADIEDIPSKNVLVDNIDRDVRALEVDAKLISHHLFKLSFHFSIIVAVISLIISIISIAIAIPPILQRDTERSKLELLIKKQLDSNRNEILDSIQKNHSVSLTQIQNLSSISVGGKLNSDTLSNKRIKK